jgi:MSHA biogenesis protein MshJ
MKLPAGLERGAAKFNQMSIRERALVTLAIVAAVVMTWMIAIFDPITAKQRALMSEMSTIQETLATNLGSLESAATNDPTVLANDKEKSLTVRLADINAQLDSQSAGLIPPERMVEVIHDVLSRQHGVKLISLHNKPLTSLVQPLAAAAKATDENSTEDEIEASTQASGPYMHPVELVVEGKYLDILAYLRALEGLSWHFYWKVLELQSTDYPLNRVRIELGTLSMDKEWIGV